MNPPEEKNIEVVVETAAVEEAVVVEVGVVEEIEAAEEVAGVETAVVVEEIEEEVEVALQRHRQSEEKSVRKRNISPSRNHSTLVLV